MLIDWFTVGAQVVNFLVLVWLMKRFLYKPILGAIDAREKKVAATLGDAEKKMTEANKVRAEFQHKTEELDQQRDALLKKAADDARIERERLLVEARGAADALAAKRSAALERDAASLNQAIGQRVQEEVFAIARKVLTDLATTSLEERVADVFARRLGEMKPEDKERLGQALKAAPGPALVRSAFDLPADERLKIQTALNRAFSAEVRLGFETTPALVSGIELAMNGQKLGWSIAEYISSLERSVSDVLKKEEKPIPKIGLRAVTPTP
jgi:F-type H+-transporting ATPase subunit b